jgi:hypothetical protein
MINAGQQQAALRKVRQEVTRVVVVVQGHVEDVHLSHLCCLGCKAAMQPLSREQAFRLNNNSLLLTHM